MRSMTTGSGGLIGSRLDDLREALRAARADFAGWRRRRSLYFDTVAELRSLSDRDLEDLGILRHDIREIAREASMSRDGS